MLNVVICLALLVVLAFVSFHHFDFVTFMSRVEGTLPRGKVYVRFTVLGCTDVGRVLAQAIPRTFKEGVTSNDVYVLAAVNSVQRGMARSPTSVISSHTAHVVSPTRLHLRFQETVKMWRQYRASNAGGLIVVPLAVAARLQEPERPYVEVGRTWRVSGAV